MGYNIELKKIEQEVSGERKEWFGVFLNGERVKEVIVYKHTDDWIKNTYGLIRTDREQPLLITGKENYFYWKSLSDITDVLIREGYLKVDKQSTLKIHHTPLNIEKKYIKNFHFDLFGNMEVMYG